MRPDEADAPTPREAPAHAIGSRVTPLRLSRLRGATLHAERGEDRVRVVPCGRAHVGGASGGEAVGRKDFDKGEVAVVFRRGYGRRGPI